MRNPKVAVIGAGYVGTAYAKLFKEPVIYDEPKGIGTREEVNACGMALIAVPTNLKDDGSLDMSIVEDVVGWLETDCILIKSALNPGTTDRLKKLYPNKKIAVSVELIGEGAYSLPFWKYPHPTDPTLHQNLIIGGTDEEATLCAEYIWERVSPDLDIHLTTAIEAEICKLWENTWGAMKVTFANEMYDLCQAYGANFMRTMQAWGSDGRVEKMHMRVVSGKRGWKSKCWDKDVPALATAGKAKGLKMGLIDQVIASNKNHLTKNG